MYRRVFTSVDYEKFYHNAFVVKLEDFTRMTEEQKAEKMSKAVEDLKTLIAGGKPKSPNAVQFKGDDCLPIVTYEYET